MQASQFLDSADGETELLLGAGRPVVPINFDDSRDYVDNNSTPAVGGRRTISYTSLQLGSSLISGPYAPRFGVGPDASWLSFLISGADLTWRLADVQRVQAEYA
ncbi:MAG TPA: hypothetical protein DC058_21275 [Planctomycetaceae bacterium]|nr:hypothetical protein [Planctomycetaceae bacterium]